MIVEDESILTRPAPAAHLRVQYGPQSDQYALVWRPAAQPEQSCPLLLLLHGGFWRPRHDLQHLAPLAAAMSASGFMVANVEYRRTPGDPRNTAEDVLGAVERLPRSISGHDGRVVLSGFSAGGHLALWLAARHAPCDAVVALAPVADLARAQQLRLSDDAVGAFIGDADIADWDPVTLPSPQVPVTVVHGIDDAIVPPELSRRYVAAHRHARLTLLPGAGHFALIDPDGSAATAVRHALLAALPG